VTLAATLQSVGLFACGVLVIGFGAGMFGHGTLTVTMNRAPKEQTGLALGAWGAVQATAAGVAVALGGIVRDVALLPGRATSTSTPGARSIAPSSPTPMPTTRAPGHRHYLAHRCCAPAWATSALQGLAYGEAVTVGACASACTRPAMCSARRRCGSNIAGRCGWPRATTSSAAHGEPTPPARLRAGALPLLHHREHLRLADLPLAPQAEVLAEVNAWWQPTPTPAAPSLLLAYSFGKAQRLLAGVDAGDRPDRRARRGGAAEPAYRAAGVALPPCRPLDAVSDKAELRARWSSRRRRCTAAPGRGAGRLQRCLRQRLDAVARRAPPPGRGPRLRAQRPRRLARAAARHPATGAERVIVTHGYEAVMVRWLQQQGLQAGSFRTEFGGDDDWPSATWSRRRWPGG
jgi:hypothetical protein